MIKHDTSKNNSPIFTWEDRYLCSRVDPQKEAQEWLTSRSEQINSSKYIVVLGLGCGYHILQLINNFPTKKILVIETEKTIINVFKRNFPIESSAVELLHIDDEESLISNPAIQNTLKNFYVVLLHGPSINIFPKLKLFKNWLIGRNYESLQWILKTRNQLSIFKVENLGLKELNKECLSIKDLKKCVQKTNSESRKTFLKLTALEEMLS
ncbi:MAG: motility associated factor glycosyltransferase family protein [Bdellovibrionales bacterium]|nr:motility associated factor glycosyltransferase family protein [Bdellovibrionales bacterium]